MKETFAIPAVGAIIIKIVDGTEFILVQNRKKNNGDGMDGLLEIPAGKIREYENIFEALRREVWEETGLHLTSIKGEAESNFLDVEGNKTIMFSPYCVTQNLSGAYSIILSTFLCEAEGELLKQTNETENIRWVERDALKEIVDNSPESIFLMHVHALRKYLEQKN
ncbi:MAG: NUDIX domain-containing protein [Lachnospiraceae bacterium]|nr:NUDIX domain-containing protein [Lachnospiraceae bacterium]